MFRYIPLKILPPYITPKGTLILAKVDTNPSLIKTKEITIAHKKYQQILKNLNKTLSELVKNEPIHKVRTALQENNGIVYAQIAHKSKNRYKLIVYPYLDIKMPQITADSS